MASTMMETSCCIVGGGPAGMMLGYLLAKQGVAVTVLEKHEDFFRDFRGDTVHPSTLEVLKELGLLEEFLELPHQRVESLKAVVGDSTFEIADFRHVSRECDRPRACVIALIAGAPQPRNVSPQSAATFAARLGRRAPPRSRHK